MINFKFFNKKEKNKFTPLIFIIASMGALIMLPLFFLYLKSFFGIASETKNIEHQNSYNAAKYYDSSDPFITKVRSTD